MKILFSILGIFVLIIAIFGITERLASERIEVVVLHTENEAGAQKTTRLWVVDLDGYPYLRAGDEASGWYQRLQSKPTVSLTRGSKTARYRYEVDTESREAVNRLMQEKYTWGDKFFALVLNNRSEAIPIKLIQLEAADQ